MTAPRLFGLIPAAGSGARMGAALPKQYAALAGKTMLEHAIDALLADARIARVIVVVAPEEARWRGLAAHERVEFAPVGGASRAHSVCNGLDALRAHAAPVDWVLVHDAARPCLAADALRRLIDTLIDDPVGGLLATPLADTLKRAAGERVEQTVSRAGLWRAQTPQMFRFGLLREALAADGLEALTDEAAAIEQRGMRPLLVAGSASNMKVTTPDDWPLAEAILRIQRRVD